MLQPEGLSYAALDRVSVARPRSVTAGDHDAQTGSAMLAPLQEERVSIEVPTLAAAKQALELRLLAQTTLRAEGLSLAGRD